MFIGAVSPVFLLIGLVALGLSIWALVDAITRPTWAWEASGQNKTLWIVLIVVGLFICGLIISLVYLLAIRPKVVAAQAGGSPGGSGGYGATGGYGGTGASAGWNPPPPPPGDPGGYNPPPSTSSSPPPPPGGPPPGWYPDPAGSGQSRYWNGTAWTEQGPPQ